MLVMLLKHRLGVDPAIGRINRLPLNSNGHVVTSLYFGNSEDVSHGQTVSQNTMGDKGFKMHRYLTG